MQALSPTLLTLIAALTLGLAGGAHCALMCGPLCAACVHGRSPDHGAALLKLHGGRVLGYAGLGVIAGSLGGLAPWALGEVGLTALRVAAALALIFAGAVLLGWRGAERLAARALPLWQRWASRGPQQQPLLTGIAWALLPCGLLYAALFLTASGGSPLTGGLAMALFAIGTLPATYASALTLLRLRQTRTKGRWSGPAGVALATLGCIALIAPLVVDHSTLGPTAQWLMDCLSPVAR